MNATTSAPLKLTYRQQLADPRWKRLAITLKDEAGWLCEHCEKPQSVEVELTIHHTYYISGLMLWEHPRCLMMCLCTPCHWTRQKLEEAIYIGVADVMRLKSNEELMAQPIYAFFTEGFTLSTSTTSDE